MKSEDEVSQEIRLEAPKHGIILMRNNIGVMQDATGRNVRYGLCNDTKEMNKNLKSSDYVGITPVIITQAMVGMTIGTFTAVEVKKEGWDWDGTPRELAQRNFLNWIYANHGVAGFCKSVEQFRRLIDK